jgi:hypothetical protein
VARAAPEGAVREKVVRLHSLQSLSSQRLVLLSPPQVRFLPPNPRQSGEQWIGEVDSPLQPHRSISRLCLRRNAAPPTCWVSSSEEAPEVTVQVESSCGPDGGKEAADFSLQRLALPRQFGGRSENLG